jgi:hypothetical protein
LADDAVVQRIEWATLGYMAVTGIVAVGGYLLWGRGNGQQRAPRGNAQRDQILAAQREAARRDAERKEREAKAKEPKPKRVITTTRDSESYSSSSVSSGSSGSSGSSNSSTTELAQLDEKLAGATTVQQVDAIARPFASTDRAAQSRIARRRAVLAASTSSGGGDTKATFGSFEARVGHGIDGYAIAWGGATSTDKAQANQMIDDLTEYTVLTEIRNLKKYPLVRLDDQGHTGNNFQIQLNDNDENGEKKARGLSKTTIATVLIDAAAKRWFTPDTRRAMAAVYQQALRDSMSSGKVYTIHVNTT